MAESSRHCARSVAAAAVAVVVALDCRSSHCKGASSTEAAAAADIAASAAAEHADRAAHLSCAWRQGPANEHTQYQISEQFLDATTFEHARARSSVRQKYLVILLCAKRCARRATDARPGCCRIKSVPADWYARNLSTVPAYRALCIVFLTLTTLHLSLNGPLICCLFVHYLPMVLWNLLR